VIIRLKWLLIVSAVCLGYEFLSNLNDMIYLCITNYKISTEKPILDRLVHVRNLCIKADVRINDLKFNHPQSSLNEIHTYLIQAIGEYRRMVLQCINPIYWVKLVLFLPQRIIYYLGFNANGIFTKLLNFIYWIVNTLIALYPNEIKMIIESVIKN
jgi:hypothetical protein